MLLIFVSVVNPCFFSNGGCQHMCLLTRSADAYSLGYRCVCRIGYEITHNEKMCKSKSFSVTVKSWSSAWSSPISFFLFFCDDPYLILTLSQKTHFFRRVLLKLECIENVCKVSRLLWLSIELETYILLIEMGHDSKSFDFEMGRCWREWAIGLQVNLKT